MIRLNRLIVTGLCIVLPIGSADLAAQAYRALDTGRNAVTLPSASGLPTITAIAAAPGSGFSILHEREGNIHQLDANGWLVRRFGRSSDSTVPFQRLYTYGWHGQIPWAHELYSERVAVFDATTARVSTMIELPKIGPVRVQGMTPDGAPVVFTHFQQPNGSKPEFRFGYAVLPGFGISPKAPIATLPSDQCDMRLGDAFVPIPWCQQASGVVAPNGEWLAVVSEAPGRGAGRAAVQVVFLSMRGDTLASLRVEAPIAPVTAADAAVHLQSEVRSRRLNSGHARQLRDAVAAQPHYPIASWLIATNDRTVWLVQQTASATRYIVVSTGGREMARYSTSANVQLMAVAGQTAFGVRSSASGAQQVVKVRF